MLAHLIIRNFKMFEEVEIELGRNVVFIGPNNSGKTTALQALALWEYGVRVWTERRGEKAPPVKRPSVPLNRLDLVAIPVPDVKHLWRGLRLYDTKYVSGKRKTTSVRVAIEVHGVTSGEAWRCGMEFTYGNDESIYCRPLGWREGESGTGPSIPEAARQVRTAFLPPMSGLAAREFKQEEGTIRVFLGEGKTAEVLRNLCYALAAQEGDPRWDQLAQRIGALFPIELQRPKFMVGRGEILMTYREHRAGKREEWELDLSAAGRGLHQTILLFAFLLSNPGAVLLLDEPDAHLEILRQRQIYNALSEVAGQTGGQIIVASHSEVILREAAGHDMLVAFLGKPHRIDDRGSQVLKALAEIGFDQYALAETTGWVLYLEGPSDLEILRAFARTLGHEAAAVLERPFLVTVWNQPAKAREHFRGLREAKSDLVGFVLTDRLAKEPQDTPALREVQWTRREIENYLCFPEVLEEYAARLAGESAAGPLFQKPLVTRFRGLMRKCIKDQVKPAALRDPEDPFWRNEKVSDAFLAPVFEEFFSRLKLPNLMRKTNYHVLASLVPAERIDPEVGRVLDQILEVARQAKPEGSEDLP